MPKFEVVVPIAGAVSRIVDADTEEQALEIFYGEFSESNSEYDTSWEFCKRIVKGNVFYGPMNEMEITEVEE